MSTIQELREGRSWTRMELAVRLGVALSTVYGWENGTRSPSVASLRQIAREFGVCSDAIDLDDTTTPAPKLKRTPA